MNMTDIKEGDWVRVKQPAMCGGWMGKVTHVDTTVTFITHFAYRVKFKRNKYPSEHLFCRKDLRKIDPPSEEIQYYWTLSELEQ